MAKVKDVPKRTFWNKLMDFVKSPTTVGGVVALVSIVVSFFFKVDIEGELNEIVDVVLTQVVPAISVLFIGWRNLKAKFK